MKKFLSPLFALLLIVLLSFPAPSFAAAAADADTAAADQTLARSMALLEQGRAEEAYNLVSEQLAVEPDNFPLRLAQARAGLAAGKRDAALAAYSKLAEDYPTNSELVLEAARAQYVAGNKTEAMRLGRMVLADYEKQLFQVHGHVRAGVMFDSNANQGTSSSSIRLGDWRVSVPDAKKQESFGAYAGAALDLSYRLSLDSPWRVVGDAQASVQGYENSDLDKNRNREWQWGRAAAGMRYLKGDNLFDIRLKAEVLDHELHTNVLAVGPEIKYIHAAQPWLHLITTAGLDRRTYNRSADYNGMYGYVGEYARLFLGEKGHMLLVGARYMGASADNNDYSYDGWEGLARLDLKLPWDLTLSPQVAFSQTFYKGRATALETRDRKDDCLAVGADISYAVTPSWSIEAGYRYIDNESRSNLYDYDRHVISMGVRWSF